MHESDLIIINTSGFLQIFDYIQKIDRLSLKLISHQAVCTYVGHFYDNIIGVGFSDGSIRLVDIESSRIIAKAKLGLSDVISKIVYFNQDIFLAFTSVGSVFAFSLKNSKILFSSELNSCQISSIFVDGSRLITCGFDSSLLVTIINDGFSKSVSLTMDIPLIDIFKKDDLFFGINSRGHVYTFDSGLGSIIHKDHICASSELTFTQCDFRNLFVVIDGAFLATLSGETCKILSIIPIRLGPIIAANFLKPSNLIVYCSSRPEIVISDAFDFFQSALLVGPEESCICIAASRNRETIAAGSRSGTIYIWKSFYGVPISLFTSKLDGHSGSVSSICFSPCGNFLISGGSDSIIKGWDINTGRSIWTIKAHDKDINSIDYHPEEDVVLCSSQDKKLSLIKALDGTVLDIFAAHRRSVWSAKFDTLGKYIVSSSADKTIKIWSYMTKECIKTIEGHSSSVLNALFYEKSSKIVSCSSCGVIKVHGISDSRNVISMEDHNDRIWSIDLSSDERLLLSASDDQSIKIWRNTTELITQCELERTEKLIKNEQDLANMIIRSDLLHALNLALDLQKGQTIFDILFKHGFNSNFSELAKHLGVFSKEPMKLTFLFNLIRDLNTQFNKMAISQLILYVLLSSHKSDFHKEDFIQIFNSLIAHSKQHISKIDDFIVKSNLCDLIISEGLISE